MNEILTFEKLLLSELRIISISNINNDIIDNDIVKAVTVNEELLALGYTLTPDDIVNLAKSNDIDNFLNKFKGIIGNVNAKPMYPNYPNQVMNMDEATFRFHQLIHYASTYGIENFANIDVVRGWLPDVEDTEKTVDDETLINAKIIKLFINSENDSIYKHVYNKILSKRERMTDKEKILVCECIKHLSLNDLTNITVPFKQNLLEIFYSIFIADIDSNTKKAMLFSICQHTGDVWKCVDYVITKFNFHFKTSQKRLIVKLLESYTVDDFQSNLVVSKKKADRVNLMLQYLDYNNYSRNPEFRQIVAIFRSGYLSSWEGLAKSMVECKASGALEFICKRPGTALRMLTYLLRNGYNNSEIYRKLSPNIDGINLQMLVSICTHFGKTVEYWKDINKYLEAKNVYSICYALMCKKFLSMCTPIYSKKVFIDTAEYDLKHSKLLINDKSSEGGYIRSGIAYKIPNSINRLRFFVYWNDSRRVDVDLHGSASDINGKDIFIGWSDAYRTNNPNASIIYSGDITHSDAAEYIDIDLSDESIKNVTFNIDVYNIAGKYSGTFKDIDECYVGCMAVNSIGEDVKLYNPKNCFFTHYLTGNYSTVNYGYVDVNNRYLMYVGKSTDEGYNTQYHNYETEFSLKEYLYTLMKCQNSSLVSSKSEADVVLVMGKADSDNKEVSLVDNNFFLDTE